jgi:hypothetical protein
MRCLIIAGLGLLGIAVLGLLGLIAYSLCAIAGESDTKSGCK